MIHQTQQTVPNTSTVVEIVNIQSKSSQMLMIPLHRSHFFLEILRIIDISKTPVISLKWCYLSMPLFVLFHEQLFSKRSLAHSFNGKTSWYTFKHRLSASFNTLPL